MAVYRFYDLQNRETGEKKRDLLSEKEVIDLSETSIWEVVLPEEMGEAPAIISGRTPRPDSGFRDVLKKIKRNNIHSKINTY
jgi:hypothetical protein